MSPARISNQKQTAKAFAQKPEDANHPAVRVIGVWSEMPPGSRWSNEGVTRVLGFLIEGAAETSRLRFEVVVPRGMRAIVEEDLRGLAATEFVHWRVHEPPSEGANADMAPPKGDWLPTASAPCNRCARSFASIPKPVFSFLLGLAALVTLPIVLLVSLALHRLHYSAISQSFARVGAAFFRPQQLLSNLFQRLKPRFGSSFADFADAFGNIVNPPPHTSPPPAVNGNFTEQMERMADWANENVAVDGWVVLFPFYLGCKRLKKPKAVIFPDALVYDFPLGWRDGPFWGANEHWPNWRNKCADVFADGGTIITFSEHVAVRHCQHMFGVCKERLRCIPLAAPDLLPYAPYLSSANRLGDTNSRRHAADLIRAFCGTRGISYLSNFPFEEVPYFISATQDRPSKNLGLAAEAARILTREMGGGIKMLTTARFMFGETWTTLPSTLEVHQLQLEILSLPDVPREVHAALFHCAALTVHSSFFEGIVGALPLFEAMSVGCPVIAARGPHTEELLNSEPEFEQYLFDPYDATALAMLIQHVLANRVEIAIHQKAIADRIRKRTWGDAANAYADAACNIAPPGTHLGATDEARLVSSMEQSTLAGKPGSAARSLESIEPRPSKLSTYRHG